MLDSSRRLRVDDSRPKLPRPQKCEPVEPATAPMAGNVQPASSSIVYWGGEERVSEGFALALSALGFGAGFPPVTQAPSLDFPNTEET
jgi:hypothetical protein